MLKKPFKSCTQFPRKSWVVQLSNVTDPALGHCDVLFVNFLIFFLHDEALSFLDNRSHSVSLPKHRMGILVCMTYPFKLKLPNVLIY